MVWHMSVIVALGRLIAKDCYESEASLGYVESSVPDWISK